MKVYIIFRDSEIHEVHQDPDRAEARFNDCINEDSDQTYSWSLCGWPVITE